MVDFVGGRCLDQGDRKTMEDGHFISENFNKYLSKDGKCNIGVPRQMFNVYDGHGGMKAMKWLEKNFHFIIAEVFNEMGDSDVKGALFEAFRRSEQRLLSSILELKDTSGSTCTVCLVVDNKLTTAYVGDSPAYLLCKDNIVDSLTIDHHPDVNEEMLRIKEQGGEVFQSEKLLYPNMCCGLIKKKILKGTARVMPGGLAVSRSLGDPKCKLKSYGGQPGCVSWEPQFEERELNDEVFGIIVCSDGITQGMRKPKTREKGAKFLRNEFLKQYKLFYDELEHDGRIFNSRSPKPNEPKMSYLMRCLSRHLVDAVYSVFRVGYEEKRDNTTVICAVNPFAPIFGKKRTKKN